jgi:hypothetical protein
MSQDAYRERVSTRGQHLETISGIFDAIYPPVLDLEYPYETLTASPGLRYIHPLPETHTGCMALDLWNVSSLLQCLQIVLHSGDS